MGFLRFQFRDFSCLIDTSKCTKNDKILRRLGTKLTFSAVFRRNGPNPCCKEHENKVFQNINKQIVSNSIKTLALPLSYHMKVFLYQEMEETVSLLEKMYLPVKRKIKILETPGLHLTWVAFRNTYKMFSKSIADRNNLIRQLEC